MTKLEISNENVEKSAERRFKIYYFILKFKALHIRY
jgi:hypothetical protein